MNTNDMSMIDGEPDTSRGVSPVPREGVGNLPPGGGKAPLPYDQWRYNYSGAQNERNEVNNGSDGI